MPKRKMPIRYVGDRPEFFDYLYGSKATWPQDGVVSVEIPVAIKLLQHPEFEDARDVDDQLSHTPKELLALPDLPDEPAEKKKDEETEELDREEPPLVNLEALTKDQIAEYAQRNFGIVLDKGEKKADLINTVRLQMGKRVV